MGKPRGKIEAALGIDSSEPKWIGAKIGTVSALVAFCGAFVFFVGYENLGFTIAVLGAIGAFVGAGAHVIGMISQLLDSK